MMEVLVVAVVVVVVVVLVVVGRGWRTARKGTALIVTGPGGPRVSFARTLALPLVHAVEALDVAVHTIVLERRGREGLGCRDNIRVDVRVSFTVRVNRTAEDVLKVADNVGCARAGDPAALHELLAGRFVAALRAVARSYMFDELMNEREGYRDRVLEEIGRELDGFVLEDMAIESLEQTPIAALDPNDILDAEGIRNITERTSREQVRTHELQRRMQLDLAHEDLRADERIARIEAERAFAQSRR